MSCRKIRRSLSRYYREELSIKEKESVDRHLLTCESCAREAQGFKALIDASSGLDSFAPSPTFESKLERKIRVLPALEKEPKAKSLFTVFPSLRWAFIPTAALAVALFLVLRGGFDKSQTISEKPESAISPETSLVRTPTKSESEPVLAAGLQSYGSGSGTDSQKVDFPMRKRASSGEVFVMDNVKLSDLEELPDSRIAERRSAYFVIDAVNSRPVDNGQTNVGYILPAVSTASSKMRKVY